MGQFSNIPNHLASFNRLEGKGCCPSGLCSMGRPIAMRRTSRFSSYGKPLAFGFGLLSVVSPLYINRRPVVDPELKEQPIDLTSWVPLLILVLLLATALSLYLDRRCTRLDPYWIHRVGGSSSGIIIILVILALVIWCKASYWEG